MLDSTDHPGSGRATSVVVRMLPALAITLGLLGLAAATTPFLAIGSGVLVGCAVVLELAGWHGATRAHALTLGTAALIGAIVGAVGLGGLAVLEHHSATSKPDPAPTGDSVARR